MKLLDQVRQVLRVRHYSYRTEQCYVAWMMHYLQFCKGDGAWKHPRELGAADGTVLSLAFSADGKMLVSGGRDTSALVWDVLGSGKMPGRSPAIVPKATSPEN